MVFASGGHCHIRGHKNTDSGAVGPDGRWEADLAFKMKTRVIEILESKGYNVITDLPTESLKEYLARIKPGPASVVVEYHFDASVNPKATGTSSLVADNATKHSIGLGAELAEATSRILGIKLRDGGDGDKVLFEKESHRGRLALMREAGTVVLHEVCFISNPDDMAAFDDPTKFEALCQAHATIIGKYEDLIK